MHWAVTSGVVDGAELGFDSSGFKFKAYIQLREDVNKKWIPASRPPPGCWRRQITSVCAIVQWAERELINWSFRGWETRKNLDCGIAAAMHKHRSLFHNYNETKRVAVSGVVSHWICAVVWSQMVSYSQQQQQQQQSRSACCWFQNEQHPAAAAVVLNSSSFSLN